MVWSSISQHALLQKQRLLLLFFFPRRFDYRRCRRKGLSPLLPFDRWLDLKSMQSIRPTAHLILLVINHRYFSQTTPIRC